METPVIRSRVYELYFCKKKCGEAADMSAVTTQPTPFGVLKREKHIESVWGEFKGRRGVEPGEPLNTIQLSATGGTVTEPIGMCLGRSKEVLEEMESDGDSELKEQSSRAHLKELGGRQWAEASYRPLPLSTHPEAGQQLHGLRPLQQLHQLCITAKAELQGPTCDPARCYTITNQTGRQLYVASEDTSCLCLNLCGPARSCCIKIYNHQSEEVLHFIRPFRVDACCFGCCLMEMSVFNSRKELIGSVKQRWSMFTPLLEVCDPEGCGIMKIHGACCPCRCSADQEFQVTSRIGNRLGLIWKRWRGFNAEFNMDHDHFGVDFPANMNPNAKVLLLSAAFLLNYMFFEMS
uniref:Phospholipid scramblase n=1 Tax=Callorhinchus milii TaxID=7868 RepID=A0A4W3HXP0_CALMI|eukprot:gi/632934143/ref/XP_007901083.1/ PREDICTED: phospholipid scramblase 2-like isoform X1 [Callorhinchus milii]